MTCLKKVGGCLRQKRRRSRSGWPFRNQQGSSGRRLISQVLSALGSSTGQHFPTVGRSHSLAKAMFHFTVPLFGLIRTKHVTSSFRLARIHYILTQREKSSAIFRILPPLPACAPLPCQNPSGIFLKRIFPVCSSPLRTRACSMLKPTVQVTEIRAQVLPRVQPLPLLVSFLIQLICFHLNMPCQHLQGLNGRPRPIEDKIGLPPGGFHKFVMISR